MACIGQTEDKMCYCYTPSEYMQNYHHNHLKQSKLNKSMDHMKKVKPIIWGILYAGWLISLLEYAVLFFSSLSFYLSLFCVVFSFP